MCTTQVGVSDTIFSETSLVRPWAGCQELDPAASSGGRITGHDELDAGIPAGGGQVVRRPVRNHSAHLPEAANQREVGGAELAVVHRDDHAAHKIVITP
jgi:hypothetical protein